MKMKVKAICNTLKYVCGSALCLLFAGFLAQSLCQVSTKPQLASSLDEVPNHNYIPDIEQLRNVGKRSEALNMTRFVLHHSDMPGQEEAKQLEQDLNKEITFHWSRTKRAVSGFIKGTGNSIEELSGAIASDMIAYGDVRDLIKQGYYKVTGKETDPVIAALAGIGLLTEVVDAADWAPAVFKAFRKAGALSKQFGDFLISTCKKSVKTRKLDSALKATFTNTRNLVDKMGIEQASTMFKHVDTPADLKAISRVAEKNANAAYFTVKNGGPDGIDLAKHLGNTDSGINALNKAAKKGPSGIAWLKRGGVGHKHVTRIRFGARLLKNLHLKRPQQFITKIATKYPGIRKSLWAVSFIAAFAGTIGFVTLGLRIYAMKRRSPTLNSKRKAKP